MKLKRLLLSTIPALLMIISVSAQDTKPVEEFKPSGKMDGKIFADVYKTFNQPETGSLHQSTSVMELKRAYFGYNYQFAPVWNARVLVDISNDAPNVDRGVFFKNAFVQYKKGSLSAILGIQDTYSFKLYDKTFNKRYLQNPYHDQFKYYTSADLGASAEYVIGDFSADLSVFNGEGFRRVQSDNGYRIGLGLTGKFIDKKLTLRLYADYLSKEYQQSTLTAFIAYQVADKFTLGAEADYQYHPDYAAITATTPLSGKANTTTGDLSGGKTATTTYSLLKAQDKNHYGGSVFGTFFINKNWNVFARYDYTTATSFTAEPAYGKTKFLTGSQEIAGVEYVYSKNLRFAADYQGFNSDLGGVEVVSKAFLHVEVAF